VKCELPGGTEPRGHQEYLAPYVFKRADRATEASHDSSLFVGLFNSFDPPVQSQKSCDNRSADLLELVVREVDFVELRVQ